MRICVAQTRPVKGDIIRNIAQHKHIIDAASSYEAHIIIFPELSITGYEPRLAQELSTVQDDSRFDDFQKIAEVRKLVIGIGAPIRSSAGIHIAMVLFRPNEPRETYCKKYLHGDEEPFFVPGESSIRLIGDQNDVALAICYELSIPDHSANAFKNGARAYIASTAKTADGVKHAMETLSAIAQRYSMNVLMSNCTGPCDNFEAAGGTAVWNNKGVLLRQLDAGTEGFLIFDTKTQEAVEKTMSSSSNAMA